MSREMSSTETEVEAPGEELVDDGLRKLAVGGDVIDELCSRKTLWAIHEACTYSGSTVIG